MSHEQRAETAVAVSAEPKASSLFSTESYHNALDRLRKVLADSLPLAVLVGDDKSGESFIIQNFLAGIEDDAAVAHITELGADAVAGTREIVQALGIDSDSEDLADLEDILSMFLSMQKMHGRRTIICIEATPDNGHWMPAVVRGLVELEMEGRFGLLMIMAGRASLNDVLGNSPMDEIPEEELLRIALEPFTPADTEAYLRWRIESGGDATIDEIFEHNAITLVHELSEGVPDRLGSLCTTCLQIAEGEGTIPVTAAIVKHADQLLKLTPAVQLSTDAEPSVAANAVRPAGQRLVVRIHGKVTQEQTLKQGHTLIGRDKSCDLYLANSSVSRRHAVIVNSSNGVAISDLSSTNGTSVNGRLVKKCMLENNALIDLGECQLEYIAGDDGLT